MNGRWARRGARNGGTMLNRYRSAYRVTTFLCGGAGLFLAGTVHAQQLNSVGSSQQGNILSQQIVYTPRLELRETYTDNSALTATDKDSDFVTQGTVGLTVTRQSAGMNLYFDGTASYDKYADRDEFDGFRPRVLTVNTFNLIENRLFLDARASVRERAIRRSTPGPAVSRSVPTNRTRIITYSLTPQFIHDFDGHAQAEILVGYSGTRFGETDVGDNTGAPSNTQDINAAATLSSGWRATRMRWQLNASMIRNNREARQRSVSGLLEYAVGRGVIPFIRTGYDDIKDRDLNEDKRSGVYYAAGLNWQPGPRLSFNGEIGHRFGSLSGAASLQYAIASNLRLIVRYSEGISTQQQALSRSLGLLQFSETGGIVDAVGTPPNTNRKTLDLVNGSFKAQNLSVGLTGNVVGTNVLLRGYRITRKFDATSTRPAQSETTAGASLQLVHPFTNGITARLGGTYSDTLDPRTPADTDTRYSGRFALSYDITTDLSISASYVYSNQLTQVGRFIENTISLFVSKSF